MAAAHPPRTTYTDYDAMLADPDVDAVIVAIADQFHVSAARQAVAAGKHVLVEKPMGVDGRGVRGARAGRRDAGVVLQVGTMRRYDPGIAYARRLHPARDGRACWRSRRVVLRLHLPLHR